MQSTGHWKNQTQNKKIGISSKFQAQASGFRVIGRFSVIFNPSFLALGHIPLVPRTGRIIDLWKYITANFIRNCFSNLCLDKIFLKVCRYISFSILKCSPFNRTGFRPQTFTFEWISGPCRPFQCLASKFLNFYKFSSSWSYLIVQAFGPSGCSNVDDRVVY